MKLLLSLIVGLVFGGMATYLFLDSMPPPAQSPQAEIARLQKELTKQTSEVKRLTTIMPRIEKTIAEKSRDTTAAILGDLKAGRPVDINRVYHQVKPVMRDLSPIFDHLRRRDLRKDHARIATHMAEAYQLSDSQKKALEQWLGEESVRQQEAFNAMVYSDQSTFEDLIRSSKYQREDKGLDEFMERNLRGPALDRFRTDRLTERAHRMETRANHQVDTLTSALRLDEAQGDRLFGIMARSHPDYDERMKLVNIGPNRSRIASFSDREKAIKEILRPDQQRSFTDYRAQQRSAAEKELREIGLTLPADWDFLDENP